MGSIRQRKRKKGVVYRAEVCINGQRLSSTFDRKSDAQRWIEDTEAALRAGGYVGDAPSGDMGFVRALDRYLDTISIHKATNTRHREETAANHLRRNFGRKSLRQITPADVAAYRDARLAKVSPSTLQKELALLSHLYTVARAEWAMDLHNPVAGVRRPKPARGRLRFLTKEEAAALLDQCRKSRNKRLYYFVLLMLHTGMRPSEAAGLRWDQVDLGKRILDLAITKTEPRRVPITKTASEALAELKENAESEMVFLPDKVSMRVRRRPNLYFRRAYVEAVRRAGISDFTMHDLRHTAASYLLMAGVDLRTLAEILGHRTMEMVRRYTHLLDDHKLEAIDRINDLWK